MYYKYPRTKHLPFSLSIKNDDKVIDSFEELYNKKVVVTIKMDGENTTMYPDYIHARSIDSKHHESRAWVKKLHAQLAHNIPTGWRVCGENLFAKHSIHYKNLPAYFMIFSIWNDKNICLSWDETKTWATILNIPTVPVLYDGMFDLKLLQELANSFSKPKSGDEKEGFVVRLKQRFPFCNFENCVAKFVRKNHVQDDEHWLQKPVVKNLLQEMI